MYRSVAIGRRIFATLGVIALALAFSPGIACVLNAGQAPSCCAGTMCPMHNSGGHMTCGMDMSHGSAFQSCGCHSTQYTGGLVFDRVPAPPVASERFAGPAPVLVQVVFPNFQLDVLSPPPRLALS